MASTSRDDGLDFLRFSKMEGNFSSMASSGNEDAKLPYIFKAEEGEDLHGRIVHSLLLKFCFLRVFLLSFNIGEGSQRLKNLFLQIRTVFQNVERDLLRNGVDLDKFASEGNRWVQINIDDELLSSMQERLEDVNKDVKQVYDILSSKSSSFITGIMMTQEAVMENLNSLLMYVEDLKKPFNELVAPVKEEVEAALKKMRFLRNFLGFTAKRCCESWELKDVINHAEFLVRNMSCLFYLCSSINDKMNEKMVNQMKMYLSSELHKFGPLQPEEVTEMYIKALKASKSAQGNSPMVVDEFDLGFLDSLEDAVLELDSLEDAVLELDSPMASSKDQILSLHDEVRFLTISFAIYKLSDANYNSNSLELDKFSNYFMEHISTLIIGMGCLIYSINYAYEAKEFEIVVSDLQDIISIAKGESREEYETHIPKSWQLKTKFGTTNLRGTIRCLMKNFEKIKSYCSNSERQLMQAFHLGFGPHSLPCHLAKGLRKEMRSLEMAFGKFIQKHQHEHEVLEIQMIRINDIRNRTANLISSFSQGVRGRSIPVFILIDEIKKIKMTFEGLQNQMMLDTSNFPEIFEDDAEEIGEQLINASQELPSLPIEVGVIEIDQDSNLDIICPLKDEVEAVRLKAAFLEVFLSCKGIWHIEDNNLKLLHTCMCSESQSTDQDLQRLLSELNVQISRKKSFCLPMNMDCMVSSVVSRFLMPAMEEVCATVSKSSRFMTSISDEALMQNLSILQENIDVLLKCNAETISPLKEELEDVQRSLRFLRDFLGFTIKRCSKPRELKDLINHAEYLAGNVSCFLCLYCGNERMNDEIMNEMKTQFSSVIQMFSPAQTDIRETYIKALKASKSAKGSSIMLDEFDMGFLGSLRDDILKLSNNDLSCIAFNKDQVLSLQEELKFLITFFAMDGSLKEQHSEYPISSYFFETIDAFIIDTGCFIYSLNNDEKNEKMVKELNKKVSDLVASIMDVKKAARRMYDVWVPKPLQTDFPRTNAEGFISSLLWKLKEQLNTKFYVFAPLKNHIEIVEKELLSLREDFGRIAEQPSHCKELQSQWTRFVDVAYQTAHVIDSSLSMDRPIYSQKLALLNVIEDIKKIKMEPKATEISMDQPSSCSSTQVLGGSSFKERLTYERLVIFDEEAEKIKDRLISSPLNLNIISIVGMPGVGKSTLADSVFQHPSVSYYFHVRARCSVSQVHDRRRLLLEILQQVTDEVYIDADDLDEKLYRSLKGRRYLFLLDDIWNIQPWNDIKVSFPDDENGSRIIFISQNEAIASQTGLETIRCRLSPLSGEKSWKMLRMKLFGKESCPLELVNVGRKIAENCKGLPLTIDLVAGVLRVLEREEWKKVEESLMTVLFEDPQARCRKVVELSYQNLPEDLKPCFLYFAAFPEDANVPTRELILLWIAEGFVRLEETESRSLEAAAKDMLHNLISRSLVTVSRRRPLGEVDANHVHDLLHEFAAAKAQEEKFMLKIGGKAKFSTSSSANVHDEWREQYRLSIYPDNLGRFLQSDPSGPRTRALISSSTPSMDALSLKFRAFKLLSVLYIPEVRSQFCPELFRLIHLKVLAIDTFEDSDAFKIMSKIHKLQNLESFIMDRAPSRKPHVCLLLDKICKMVRLRHFCFGGNIYFKYGSEKIWKSSSLFDNLQTLYNLGAGYEEDVEKILMLMPNLVELKALFCNPDEHIYPFPKLVFLKKLEALEVTHQGKYPCKIVSIHFPPYLKKLVLSKFGLPWTHISEIGKLECLEILELKHGAFKGLKWDMVDGEFPKLKFLSLSNLDIEEWNVTEDHLSFLKQLHVAWCRKLQELPSSLADIATLEGIKVSHCTISVEDSAKRIKEEQDEIGNEGLVVEIH